jgi:hypothetical protein
MSSMRMRVESGIVGIPQNSFGNFLPYFSPFVATTAKCKKYFFFFTNSHGKCIWRPIQVLGQSRDNGGFLVRRGPAVTGAKSVVAAEPPAPEPVRDAQQNDRAVNQRQHYINHTHSHDGQYQGFRSRCILHLEINCKIKLLRSFGIGSCSSRPPDIEPAKLGFPHTAENLA